MYGLVGKLTAKSGKGAELAGILYAATRQMPGCHAYRIALDAADGDVLWITEEWDSSEAHQASLSLPAVQAALTAGRPLIEGMERLATTSPFAG